MGLLIGTLGTLGVLRDGKPLPLPASRKTRALLAYLALSRRRHTRQALCELLWDLPDDPRAALRWSLTKLRPVVNEGERERLRADREYVELALTEGEVDLHRFAAEVENPALTGRRALALWRQSEATLLEDCEMPNHGAYTLWLEQQRRRLLEMRTALARRCAQDPARDPAARADWAARWHRLAPLDPQAARAAVLLRRVTGELDLADALEAQIAQRFGEAELPRLDFTTPEIDEAPSSDNDEPIPDQQIQFAQSADGYSIALASVGDPANPPLVKAANWLTHLELDWEAPIWSPLFREFARSHHFIRYDERGCGLSDRDVAVLDQESFVADLEVVVDACGLERFPLMGISQGAAVSIEYAARHPDRVSHLILFGGYDCGWRFTADEDEAREREAVMVLTESGWGRDNPVYRRMFSQTFMPDASPEELEWFDEFQRQTTSPENAVRFLEAFSRIDVRDRLAEIQCPTLVVHSRGDQRIPFASARTMASQIPGARLVGIESRNHLLLGREPASGEFVRLVSEFIAS